MKTKDKGGRPALAPDDRSRQMVEVLSGFGIPQDKIADVIGVDGKTLRKHYATELQRGAATVEAKLVGNLLKLAGGRARRAQVIEIASGQPKGRSPTTQ